MFRGTFRSICFGHSFDLAGNESANCVPEATRFFDLLQKIYAFFSASTHRWKIVWWVAGDSDSEISISQTRRSARSDAAKAVRMGYDKISEVLVKSTSQTMSTKMQIRGRRLKVSWRRWWDLNTAFWQICGRLCWMVSIALMWRFRAAASISIMQLLS